MLNSSDRENLVKSSQTAELLVQDLKELIKSRNPFLSDIALGILERAAEIESHLKRLEVIANTGE